MTSLTVGSIATKDVVIIDKKKSIKEAIKYMVRRNLRNIVVYDDYDNSYSILMANELIRIKLNGVFFDEPISTLDLPPLDKIDASTSLLEIMDDIDKLKEYTSVIENEKLVGIISYSDIIYNLDPKMLVRSKKLAELISYYSGKVADKKELTIDVIKRIAYSPENTVVVVEKDKPVGIFTTKDFLRLSYDNTDFELPIEDNMVSPVRSLDTDKTIGDAIDFMQETNFKKIVVTNEEGCFVGVISQKQLIRMGYNKWIDYMQGQNTVLSKINKKLKEENDKLEKVVNYDFLTSLYSRSKFEDFIGYEIRKIKRYGGNFFCMLLLDIDHFKNINDTYGHLVGDCILKDLAKLLKNSLRESDIVSRWGGEEFIFLLPNSTIKDAAIVAEKMRKRIESNLFTYNIKITCSLGVTEYRDGEGDKEPFKRVDEALYTAKEEGRNRIEVKT